MKQALLLVVLAAWLPALISPTLAATRAERCARYNQELVRIEKAKKRGGSEVRLHKLEAQRQKVLAYKAKHHC